MTCPMYIMGYIIPYINLSEGNVYLIPNNFDQSKNKPKIINFD